MIYIYIYSYIHVSYPTIIGKVCGQALSRRIGHSDTLWTQLSLQLLSVHCTVETVSRILVSLHNALQ